MQKLITKGVLAASLLLLALPGPQAFAGAYLSINNSGGNSASITVSGVPFGQAIDLVYTLPGSSLPTVISNIGTTYGGSYNGTLNLNEYGIVPGSTVFVRTGGQDSNSVTVNYGGSYYGNSNYYGGSYYGGCTYNCGSPYGLSLSQNNVSLTVGQSQTVTAYPSTGSGSYGNSIYISSNSNTSIVSATVSGSQINLYGLANGSSTVSVCSSGYNYSGSACASIYVTVSGTVAGANTGNVWFSPSSPSMYVGQNLAVSVNSSVYSSGYLYPNNAYYVSSNTNSSVVSANISGTVLNLYANQTGNSTITVCHSSLQFCGTLYVTVYGSGSGGGFYGQISFSQNNPSLSLNQSLTISVYGGSGSNNYYISNNTNSSAVTASVSGNNLYLYGRNYGSATITVCQSGYSSCGMLYVNVGAGSYGGSLTLSQYSLNLAAYQSAAVNIFGSGNYYIASNSNPSAASASISGNSVSVQAYASGTASISVCQNYNSQCATLQVNVGGGYYGGGYYGGDINILNSSLPTMVLGQYYSYQLNASGGSPPYTFSLSSGALPAGLNLSSSGFLSGVPQYAYTANFSVRVTDNQSRSGVTSFTIYGNSSSSSYNYGGSGYSTPSTGSGYWSGGVMGASLYKNGQLIKEGNTIYIVYRNMKSGFASLSAFRGFGFSLNNVVDAGSTGLVSSGYTISTSNASHPWGAWVKSGPTVYFVHETGLIPVPDWNTFLNNGGQENLIVSANLRDFQLPILSPMTYDDARLR